MELPTFRARLATPSDDAAVGELLVTSFIASYARRKPDYQVTPDRQKDLRNVAEKREHGAVIVLETADGKIAGCICLLKPDAPSATTWLPGFAEWKQMAVLPELHGAGASTLLTSAAFDLCREWGARGVCLHVREGLTGLYKYYERLGFSRDPHGDTTYSPTVRLIGFSQPFQPQ